VRVRRQSGDSSTAPDGRAPRWRLITARILVVLAVVLAFPAALAGYVRWQALDPATFHDTASRLIADDVVRDQVAATLVDQLYSNVDVAASLEQRLPPDQKQLAAPLAGASRVLADRLAPELLARPRVQALWIGALTESQARLIRLLDDKSTAIKTENGDVVLDLRPLVIQLGDEVAIVGNIASRLPPDAGKVTLMKSSQLGTAQDLTHVLKTTGTWLWIIPVLLAAAAIALARGRRRRELRAVAVGAIAVGVALLVLRSVGGNYLVESLVKTESVRPAGHHAWSILTALLTDTGWTLIGIGLVALFGVWLAGETSSGRAARRFLAPVIGKRVYAFGIVGVLFLLLLWWQPTVQLGRLPQVIAMAIVLAIALEALHRITVRDFPAESALPPADAFRARWEARRARQAGGAEADTVAELERLASLHRSGALSDEEFAGEKARVLAHT
jgi:hypothetical protein